MPSKFGGIAVDETPSAGGSRFGGTAVDEAPSAPGILAKQGIHLTGQPDASAAVRDKMLGYPSAGPVDQTGNFDFGQVEEGAHNLAVPGQRAHGLHQVIGGIGSGLAVPATIAGALTNPAGTAATIGRGAAGSVVARGLANVVGAGEGTQELAGDAGGIAGAAYRGMAPISRIGKTLVGSNTRTAALDMVPFGYGKKALNLGRALAEDYKNAAPPPALKPLPPAPATPQTFGASGMPASGDTAPAPTVPIRGPLPSGRRVGGLAPTSPAPPPTPTPTLATPRTLKGLSIAERLRDAMGESSPEARMNPEGQLQFGGEHPEMDEIANDDANFKRFMDNSKANPPQPGVLGRQIRMRRR